MEILFLGDGYYLVDEVTFTDVNEDIIAGPFDTVREAQEEMDTIMSVSNW